MTREPARPALATLMFNVFAQLTTVIVAERELSDAEITAALAAAAPGHGPTPPARARATEHLASFDLERTWGERSALELLADHGWLGDPRSYSRRGPLAFTLEVTPAAKSDNET